MAEEEYGLKPEDIRVDEEGRVVITNPYIAERLSAAAQLKPGTNTNCHGCTPNTVVQCGCPGPKPKL